jgi:hypothetical protein
VWIVAAVFLALAKVSWSARIYSDGEWVGRTSPWPKKCRRQSLSVIRLAPALVSPAWEFTRSDGSVAFRVSPMLFPVGAMKDFGRKVGINVDENRTR